MQLIYPEEAKEGWKVSCGCFLAQRGPLWQKQSTAVTRSCAALGRGATEQMKPPQGILPTHHLSDTVVPPLLSRSEGARLEVSHSRRCSGAAPKAAVTHAGQKEFWNWSTALTASTKAAALLGNTKHLRYPLMHWAAPKLPRGHAQKVRKALRVSKLHQLEFQSWLTYFC